MRKLLFFCLLIYANLFAETKTDSLWQVWQDENKPDTSRLEAINRIIWDKYLYTKPDSAYILAQLELDFAEKIGDFKYQAKAINAQGASHSNRGNHEIAQNLYNQVLSIQTRRDDKLGVANSYNNIAMTLKRIGDLDSSLTLHQKSQAIQKEIENSIGIANSYSNIGNIYKDKGNYQQALVYHKKCLVIRKQNKNDRAIAGMLNNIGNSHMKLGNYSEAIKLFTESLLKFEEINHKLGTANALNNIGIIYKEQKDNKKAIEYYRRALVIRKEMNDMQGMADLYNNIGSALDAEKNDSALVYHKKSLEIQEEIGNKVGMVRSFINIGNIHKQEGNTEEALALFNEGLKICKSIDDKANLSILMDVIGGVYHEFNHLTKAEKFYVEGLEIAKEIGYLDQQSNLALSLKKLYKKSGKFKKALEMHELLAKTEDSLNSEANIREIAKQEFRYSYEKQAAIDSIAAADEKMILNAQIKVSNAQQEKEKLQKYFVIAGLLVSLIFGLIILKRFRVSQEQKEIISAQKESIDAAFTELTEKNNEIIESINYAKRIQSAILPPTKTIETLLPDSFIIYKPKDIVAGDFYWLDEVDGEVLFAAADCTGHGVPGAMVSVVCHNALNRSVREEKLTVPGEILDKTREIIIKEFAKSDDKVKDGMDIALCALKGNKLTFAGAHNPLWLIRDGAIVEIKGDRQPIGLFDKPSPYRTAEMELLTGDTIYIFTDGFVDQFGGAKGKKFKSKLFKELLTSVSQETIAVQKQLIEEAFDDWKGDLEQVDDVCIIGVKV